MRKNNILILLIGVFAMLFTSCRTGESLTYFQNADEVGESIRNVDYAIEIVPADELFISVNHFQDVIVKTLYSDRHPVNQSFEISEVVRCQVSRIGFAGYFLHRREERSGQFNCLDELIFENRRCAASDVHCREVVTERFDEVHFFAQVYKIFARFVFLEKEAVKRAVRTQRLAERNVRVEHVLMAGLRLWRPI